MSEEKCVHCGAGCGRSPVVWDEKPFCCHGCKSVYQIIHDNRLERYYDIQPMAGIRIEAPGESKAFAYLDAEEIRDKMLLFNDGNTSSVRFFIPGIHCASCIWLLEHLNTLHPGVIHSQVNFPKKEVSITFKNDHISLGQLAGLLASVHYVPEITLDHLERKKPATTNKSLLIKIGIAGFSFLNIMMYSFPEYVPGGHLLEQEFRHLFGWLSFLLVLPVVFYSATDYYISAWKGLKHGIISIDIPLSLGIIALFLQSSWDVFSGHGIGFNDSLAGLLFFLLIGKWYQGKTYRALSFERDYKSYFPVAVTRLRNGQEEVTPIKNLGPGDRILVRNQELIPADSRIVEGKGNIDYSFVTGESLPVLRQTGDFIYAGGRQVGSSIELEVEKAVEQSYLTQLWNQKPGKDEGSHLNTNINKVSRYFTIVLLAIAFTAFFYWLKTDGLATAVYVFASVLIIACPCALALTTPFTFGSAMRVFGRNGLYIKNAEVIEQLYRTDTVVFDKTGTITLNRTMKIGYHGTKLSDAENGLIRSVVRHSSHPLSNALNDFLRGMDTQEPGTFEEIPGMGMTATVGGRRINIGSKTFVAGETDDETITESRVYVGFDGQTRGYFSIGNQYRDGLDKVIETLKNGYDLHLISGDNDAEYENLRRMFGETARLRFHQSPSEKLDYVNDLKEQGKKVLMIGDGLNDAGALSQSHAGISIADDVFSFSPASDAIMEASRFSRLGQFLSFTKTSMGVIRASFLISFMYNVIGLSFAVNAMLSPIVAAILMPVSSVTIVAFTTFSIRVLGRRAFGSKAIV